MTGESCFSDYALLQHGLRECLFEASAKNLPLCDGAAWHKSGTLQVFPNIEIMFIPPYTPEMNPIEQIWRELRARGFHNKAFQTLEKVVDRLCVTICNLSAATIHSITCRN